MSRNRSRRFGGGHEIDSVSERRLDRGEHLALTWVDGSSTG